MRRLAALPLLAGVVFAGCSKPAGPDSPAVSARDPKAVVARVDGKPVTEGEMVEEARLPLAAAERRYLEQVHTQKTAALDRLVERRLLEESARKQGITVEAFLEREVTRNVPEPSEATLQAVYDQTKSTGRPLPPFDGVRAEIAAFVKSQSAEEVRRALLARLRSGAKVETFLPPLLLPKVEFRADGPARGDAAAPVTIVEFSDYECEFCARAEEVVRRVLAAYPGRVRLVHEPFPLSGHPHAPKAAEAALCAGEQGRYWEMHDSLFAGQAALGVDDLKARARTLRLDGPKFDACLDSGRTAPVVEASRKLGEGIGVDATPSFFVNGRPATGLTSFERLKELVDLELAGR